MATPGSSQPSTGVFVFLFLLHSATAAPSSSYGGNTHPAIQSGDFASIPETGSDPSPPTDFPVPSVVPPEEIPVDPRPVLGAGSSQHSSGVTPNREEFLRPKRRTIAGEVHQPNQPDLKDLVSNLKTQLKESQAAQVHTRSIINVLQEKVEAQETDLSIMKNEISHMRREQAAQRELIATLRSSASDASWAVASVKRGQDQASDDLRTLKRLQEHHNETLLVMEEGIMSNALELQTSNKHVASLQHDLFQLRAQLTEDRGKMNRLQKTIAQLQQPQKVRGSEKEATNENVIVQMVDSDMTNHLSPYAPQSPSAARTVPEQGQKATVAQPKEHQVSTLPGSVEAKLAEHDFAIEVTKELLGNFSEHVTSVEGQLRLLSQRQLLDAQLLNLQQSFMNFTSQIYQLQQWRASKVEKGWEVDEHKSQYENEMASVTFHLESHSERIRMLEDLALEYRTTDQLDLHRLNQSVAKVNATVSKVNASVSRALYELSQLNSKEKEEVFLERVKSLEEGLEDTSDRVKDVELLVINVSLSQCKAANEQLADDARTGSYVRQMADVQMKISEQTTAIARLDRGLSGIFQELDKNMGTYSALAEQLNDLKKLPPEVTTIQRELFNFILQLPTDCYDVITNTGNEFSDGVYLIRPETSRQSARTFCLVEEDVIWTVIQRRTDGRESFARSWEDYRSGFGDAGSEFWLGNENIHRLTDGAHPYRLRIDMWDVLGRYWLADYASFRVHAEDALYRLELGDFRGNATDALRYSNLMPFSALDRDNDVSTTHCAQFYQSGWWYKHCHYSNLNGRYTAGMVWFHQELDEWIQMRQTTMRITMATIPDNATTRSSG